MILIDLFDTDVINTLVPVFSLRPDKEYIIVDKKNRTTRLFKNIIKAIRKRVGTEITVVTVNANDVKDISYKLRNEITLGKDPEVYLDLAGGRELLSACGYQYALENSITPLYIDFKKERLYSVTDHREICPITHLRIEDYLDAIGAKRLTSYHNAPKPEDRTRILEMAEIIFGKLDSWNVLCSRIMNSTKQSKDHMSFNKNLSYSRNERKLLADFIRLGFIIENRKSYKFADEFAKQCLTVFGTWLEMYIYYKAVGLYPEATMGIVIDWVVEDNVDSHDNEIDVLFIKKSVPVFVSCKMRKPSASDVNEVLALARRFGGRRAKGIIATTFDVEQTKDLLNSIYKRLRMLNCGYIEAKDFQEKTDVQVFNQALQMTD